MISVFRSPAVSWKWVTLIGPDAKDFLHRLTTVNVKTLGLGQGAEGCFLNAQGKIQAYFNLWNFDKDAYAFEFEAGEGDFWKSNLLKTIDQYTFAEKMEVADVTEKLEWAWLFVDAADLPSVSASLSQNETLAIEDEIRVCHHGESQFGKIWLSAWAKPGRLSQWLGRLKPEPVQISHEELELWRISHLTPRVGREILEGSSPLEFGMKNAIASQKGCYPGQEVIERTIALGSPPRRLALINGTLDSSENKLPQIIAPGSPIFNNAAEPIEVGQLTSITQKGNQFFALALVKKLHAKEGFPVQLSRELQLNGVISRISMHT